MPMDCPQCGLINPDAALRCDCGYDFSGQMEESYLEPSDRPLGFLANPVTRAIAIVLLALSGLVQFGRWITPRIRLVPWAPQVQLELMAFSLLTFLVGSFLLWRHRQHAALEALRSGTTNSGVLYLRSFQADASPVKHFASHRTLTGLSVVQMLSGLTTPEEELRNAIRPIGPLVAVGQPGEKLPKPGATRLYAGDEAWRGLVSRRMISAKLVVFRAGHGGVPTSTGFPALSPLLKPERCPAGLSHPGTLLSRLCSKLRRRYHHGPWPRGGAHAETVSKRLGNEVRRRTLLGR